MRIVKTSIFTVVALMLGVAMVADADAHGRHRHRSSVHFGISVGAPAFWYAPPYYYRPYYYPYYPPAVVVPSEPTMYIERNAPPAPAAPASSYWYYCPDSQTYYPYVKECAGPWQRVVPQPPPS